MRFKEIEIRNFGSFADLNVKFGPGINVIEGLNGTGKTQVMGAVIAAVLGKSAVSIENGGQSPSSLTLSIQGKDSTETLTLVIAIDPEGRPAFNRQSSASTGSPKEHPSSEILSALSDSKGPQFLLSDNSKPRGLNLASAESLLPEGLKDDQYWLHFRSLLDVTHGASQGVRHLRVLVEEFVARKEMLTQLPLILSDFFGPLDSAAIDLSVSLLESLAETQQIIVTTNHHLPFRNAIVTKLEGRSSQLKTVGYYNYALERQQPRLVSTRPSKWIKGRAFAKQEDRSCEFKEVKGGNPLSSIKSVVDQYVVAFLNAGVPQEGAIFWGIRNGDRAITGVNLNDQSCDELRRIVTEKLHQITPALAPTRYQIDLHSVSDGQNTIPNLYVVEVRVPSVRRSLLFATGSQEVYVKTDSGKKKLSALEIQRELLHRHGIDDRS
jgi:hypothetical protein